jgi:hypothetical protein
MPSAFCNMDYLGNVVTTSVVRLDSDCLSRYYGLQPCTMASTPGNRTASQVNGLTNTTI